MEFEWDEAKAQTNRRKHGIDFETAVYVFSDPFAIERADPWSHGNGEDRFLLTGFGGGSLLTVVYTERGDTIRIISARRATRREHDDYQIENSQS